MAPVESQTSSLRHAPACRRYAAVVTGLLLAIALLQTARPMAAQRLSRSRNRPERDSLYAGFRSVPPSARMQMFWRIFGPAWTKPEIDRELSALKQAEVGGVMTCFTYPVALDDPAAGIRNGAYLSPEFLSTFGYAAQSARDRGLEFAVCGGTGWPFGGLTVSPSDSAQRIRRINASPLPNGAGWQIPALRREERVAYAFSGGRDITASLSGDRLPSTADGAAPILFVVGPTYMQVKRPALGAEGLVVDHYSREATARYLNSAVEPLVRSAPASSPIHTLFCDSLEVYRANWTAGLPAAFRNRRGYDLIPHLPELFDDKAPTATALRFDYWRTLAEMAEEEFARTVHDWCRRRGIRFALEAYGTPPMGLTAAAQCDVPWGEQYEYRGFSFSRYAVSGAHLAGRRLIGAEAWTWAGTPNRLADSLDALKLCSDWHFLAGENQLTGVDFPYSPESAGSPGWMPYYGPVMGLSNPQWAVFPALARYINRCQWMLQQGRPVADVALYTPTEDCLAGGGVEQMPLNFLLRDRFAAVKTDEFGMEKARQHYAKTVTGILDAGLNFDGIDFFAMNRLASVRSGVLQAGDGRYRAIVLPPLDAIDAEALAKIVAFCRSGGVVAAVGSLPKRAAGLRGEQADRRVASLLREMFGADYGLPAAEPLRRRCGRGTAVRLAEEEQLTAALRELIGPDLEAALPKRAGAVLHVHRTLPGREIYFLWPGEQPPDRLEGSLRGRGRISFWNPMDGTVRAVPAQIDRGRTRFSLQPVSSGFLCLEPGAHPGSLAERANHTPVVRKALQRWSVQFAGPDAPAAIQPSRLVSWTEWPGGRYFSGGGIYRTTLTATGPMLRSCALCLQELHEAAEVAVNGKRAGALFTRPYRLEIARLLKPGANRIEIRVYNLPVNRVLGLPDPDLKSLRAAYGDRFPAPEEKAIMNAPAPSGLIGSVWIETGGGSR